MSTSAPIGLPQLAINTIDEATQVSHAPLNRLLQTGHPPHCDWLHVGQEVQDLWIADWQLPRVRLYGDREAALVLPWMLEGCISYETVTVAVEAAA